MMTITDMFGWLGTIVSICFFTFPVRQFYNLIKKKIKYTDIHIIIIIGNYISSLVWLIYGFSINMKQIKICYSIGALISIIWIWTYLIYMGKKKISHSLIFTMILSALTFATYIILTVVITDKKVIGEVCFIVCSITYISPVQLIIKVINSKNFKLIPIVSAIISAIGYGSWTIFGLFNFNANIIIPNLVGLAFSLAQVILFRVYKNKRALTEELNNISHSVIGAVKNVVDKTVEIANSINPSEKQSKNSQNYNNTEPGLKVNNIINNSSNNNQNVNENIDDININKINNNPLN
jgi:solute carrier family 50 protein (sugar transporter)